MDELQDASLYRYLSEQRGVRIAAIEETLEPECVSPEEAAHLDIPTGTAMSLSHRTAREGGGRVVEVSDNRIRGDSYRFTVHRRLDGDAA